MCAREFTRAHRVFKLWKNPNALTRCASTCSASFAKADAVRRWTPANVPGSKIFEGSARPNGASGCPNFCGHGRRLSTPHQASVPAHSTRISPPPRANYRRSSAHHLTRKTGVGFSLSAPGKIVVIAHAKIFSRDESMHCDFSMMNSDTRGRRFRTRLCASREDKWSASSRRASTVVEGCAASGQGTFSGRPNALDANMR